MTSRINYVTSIKRKPDEPDKDYITILLIGSHTPHGMKTYGPKSLLKIGSKILIEHQIDSLKKALVSFEVVLSSGFESQKIIKRIENIRFVENQLYETTNEVECLRLGLNNILSDKILIMPEDLWFSRHLIDIINIKQSCLIFENNGNLNGDTLGLTIVDNLVTIMSFDNDNNKWCYAAYFQGEDLQKLKRYCNTRKYGKMYFFELLNIMLEENFKIRGATSSSIKVVKIDSPKGLKSVNENTNLQ